MSDIPLVSAIIPAFNAEPYVAAAVSSVLCQTYPSVETIVVNDGSTDGTGAVLAGFGNRIVLIDQPNHGMAAARNAGARAAKGEWIAFLDADDEWLPHKLERQIEAAADSSVFVYSDRYNIGARGSLPKVQSSVHRMFEGDAFLNLLLIGNVITASSVLVRTHVFQQQGGFAEMLRGTEDWDLWLRIAAQHEIRFCPEPLVKYRFHPGMTSGNPGRMSTMRVEVVRRALLLPRAKLLPRSVVRHIWASTWRTNGFGAARNGQYGAALSAYGRAILFAPWSLGTWKDIARTAIRRTV